MFPVFPTVTLFGLEGHILVKLMYVVEFFKLLVSKVTFIDFTFTLGKLIALAECF